MQENSELFIGLDVSKNSHAVADAGQLLSVITDVAPFLCDRVCARAVLKNSISSA